MINDNIITNKNFTSVIIMEGFRLDIYFTNRLFNQDIFISTLFATIFMKIDASECIFRSKKMLMVIILQFMP